MTAEVKCIEWDGSEEIMRTAGDSHAATPIVDTPTQTPSTSPQEALCEVFEFPAGQYTPGSQMAPKELKRPFVGRRTNITLSSIEFKEDVPVTPTHAAEPIKNVEDIWKIQEYLLKENRYRDNLLFTCGVNFGLRVGDLLRLKVGHLLEADGQSYRPRIDLVEEKTTKRRTVFLNDAVMDAADLYFNDLQIRDQVVNLNDYLFRSRSNNGRKENKPIDIRNVERMLKDVINKKCGIDIHASTHCLRKTFAYHVIMGAKDRSRAVEFLQKIFGHSNSSVTLMYAGITDDEIKETYQNLNLGMKPQDERGFNWAQSSGYTFQGRK